MVDVLLSLVGVAITALGAWGVRTNRYRLSQAWTARGVSLSDVATLRPDDGWVKLEGTVRAIEDDTLDAVVTDREVVVRVMVLEKRERSSGRGSSNTRRTWNPKGRTVDAVPFYLDDGTGTARVEVPADEVLTNYQLLTPGHEPYTTSFTLDSQRTVVSGGWERGVLDDAFDHEVDSEGTYRVREGVLEPDQTAYVAGWTRQPEGWSEEDVVVTGEPDPKRMIVADRPESAAESSSLFRGSVFMAVSLSILAAGGGLLLIGLRVI